MVGNNKYISLKWYSVLMFVISFNSYSQKYLEPDQIKQFNITVNYDDHTVKTQMLSQNKDITVDNDLFYVWYASQKIIETKGGYEGKLLHGKYTAFYLNNQLKEQGQIKYGLKNKEWKYWNPDGKLREVINWKNGRKNGKYALYNEYGQPMAKSSFKNDKLNGAFYTYNQNGSVAEKKKYKNGEEIIKKVKIRKEKKQKVPKEKKSKESQQNQDSKKDSPALKKSSKKKSDKKSKDSTPSKTKGITT